MKAIEDYFVDWEAHVFGFGYGTGEAPVLAALDIFLNACTRNTTERGYDYKELEEKLTPPTAWLLINALCRADIIEYGTSPHYGWLSLNGCSLRDFCVGKSVLALVTLTERDQDYIRCAPGYCNCTDSDCRKLNPFWRDRNKA